MRRMREDQECSACMREERSPVCSMRDGRTFPTRCHAMRCQQIPANQLESGTCADRVNDHSYGSCCMEGRIEHAALNFLIHLAGFLFSG